MSRRSKAKFLFGIVLALLGLGLASSWALGSLLMRPSAAMVPAATAPARDLSIRSSDGLTLTATYWPGRRANSPGVLLLHGVRSSRQAMAANAAWLASRGYAVLTLDFRGHGGSTPATGSFGLKESRDAKAGFDWLRKKQGGAPVAIVGVSLGGAATLLGDEGPVQASALVLQAVYPDIRHAIRNRIAAVASPAPAFLLEPLLSYQSWLRFGVGPDRLSPLTSLRRYAGPVLVIGGGEDSYTPAGETRQMLDAAQGPKQLWLVAGANHHEVSGLSSNEYRENIQGFLEAHVPVD